jgi:uncharacterized OB-fold protein
MAILDDVTQLQRQRLEHGRPTPTIYEWNRPFFAGGIEGRLMLQRCSRCKALIYYPRLVCPSCLSPEYQWETLSGRGTVFSFAIVWRPNHPAFADQIPITLAIVDLREGPQMVTALVDCAPDRVEIGMDVTVVFDMIADGIALPKFTPLS